MLRFSENSKRAGVQELQKDWRTGNGAMEQWSNGAMEQWSNSERRHRKSSFLSGKKFPENGVTL
jgi:hypothetical protein